MPQTDDKTIWSRIQSGQNDPKRKQLHEKDKEFIRRFKDPSMAYNIVPIDENLNDDGGWIPEDVAVGNIPYVATNIRVKEASICFTYADWYIETQDPTLSEIPSELLKGLWKDRGWTRVTERAWLNRTVTGMGCVCVYWTDPVPGQYGGPRVEFVRISDWVVDPHVTDWLDLRWAARKIMMPRDEAQQKWPDVPELGKFEDQNAGSDARKSTALELWTYWDYDTEAVFFGKTCVQKTDNLYGQVPLLFMEGDIDLSSEFSQGDYDATVGLQVMAAWMDDVQNNIAKHGGGVLAGNPDKLDQKQKQNLERGKQQGIIWIEGGDFDNALKYLQPEPINPAVPQVQEHIQQGIDAAQGANDFMRGVITSDPKFATQVGAVEQQSGARGEKARDEYEQFCERISKLVIKWIVKFSKPQTPEEFLLIEALTSITKLAVVEGSTSYKNPAAQQQAAVQVLQVLAPLAQATNPPLNLRPLMEDVLRAFGKKDMNKYFGPPMPQQPDMTGGQPNPMQSASSPDAGAQGAASPAAPEPSPPQAM